MNKKNKQNKEIETIVEIDIKSEVEEKIKPYDLISHIWENTKQFKEWCVIRNYYTNNLNSIKKAENVKNLINSHIFSDHPFPEKASEYLMEIKIVMPQLEKLSQFFKIESQKFLKENAKWIESINNGSKNLKCINVYWDSLHDKELLKQIVDEKLINEEKKLSDLINDLDFIYSKLEKWIYERTKW